MDRVVVVVVGRVVVVRRLFVAGKMVVLNRVVVMGWVVVRRAKQGILRSYVKYSEPAGWM